MQKTKIEWCDASWNPISGCSNGCNYCYARKIYHRFGKSFKPTFHPKKLDEPGKRKKPSRIFLGSVTDLWSPGVRDNWRDAVIAKTREHHQHTYFILTKQPQEIYRAYPRKDGPPPQFYPRNFIGVSVESNDNLWRWPALVSRTLGPLKENTQKRFISFEPLLGKIDLDFKVWPDWIIIGGLTGFNKDKQYAGEIRPAVHHLLGQVPRNVPVFVKNNLLWPKKIQEFPEGRK